MKFRSLADLLGDRHSGIAPEVSVPDSSPHYVKIDLGHRQGARLAITKFDGAHVWAVSSAQLMTHLINWPLNGVSEEVLVDALHAAASAHRLKTGRSHPLAMEQARGHTDR
ncbi:hypothetical protein [Streptomyces sp. NPDC055134]